MTINPSFAKVQGRQTFSYVHMVILTMHNQFLLFSETVDTCSVEMCYLRLLKKLKIEHLQRVKKKIMVAVLNSIPFSVEHQIASLKFSKNVLTYIVYI